MTNRFPKKVIAQAQPNIAFVKYWGKRDERWNLPFADSVSVCLDSFETKVELVREEGLARDEFLWNGQKLSASYQGRFMALLGMARERSGDRSPMRLAVKTNLPSRVGLASSSACMAAFARAVDVSYGMGLTDRELSAVARLGSGSACRSVPGGFARWKRGVREDGSDSVAERIASPDHWPELEVLVVVLTTKSKDVSSSAGMMRTARTSHQFSYWVEQCQSVSDDVVDAISKRDFEALGRLTERNARSFHGLCMTAVPPLLYVRESTVSMLELVAELQREVPLFYTLDAGPNPVVFTLSSSKQMVLNAISDRFPYAAVFCCKPGGGASVCGVE